MIFKYFLLFYNTFFVFYFNIKKSKKNKKILFNPSPLENVPPSIYKIAEISTINDKSEKLHFIEPSTVWIFSQISTLPLGSHNKKKNQRSIEEKKLKKGTMTSKLRQTREKSFL